MGWAFHVSAVPLSCCCSISYQGASQLPVGMTLTLPHTRAPAEWDLKQRVRGHVSSAPESGTAQHHCLPSVAPSPSPVTQPVCLSEPEEAPIAGTHPVPEAGAGSAPQGWRHWQPRAHPARARPGEHSRAPNMLQEPGCEQMPPSHYSPSFRVHLMSPVLLLTAWRFPSRVEMKSSVSGTVTAPPLRL